MQRMTHGKPPEQWERPLMQSITNVWKQWIMRDFKTRSPCIIDWPVWTQFYNFNFNEKRFFFREINFHSESLKCLINYWILKWFASWSQPAFELLKTFIHVNTLSACRLNREINFETESICMLDEALGGMKIKKFLSLALFIDLHSVRFTSPSFLHRTRNRRSRKFHHVRCATRWKLIKYVQYVSIQFQTIF